MIPHEPELAVASEEGQPTETGVDEPEGPGVLLAEEPTRAELSEALARLRSSERALRHSEARLAAVVDSAIDAILAVDAEQRVVVFNKAAERVFRCRADEALGRTLERFIPARHHETHRVAVERFRATGESVRGMSHAAHVTALRADGEEFTAEAYISRAVTDGNVALTVVLRDVTEHLRAKAERRRLEEQLHLAQRLDAIGTLAGGIAHDINNMLQVILANVELARQDLTAPGPGAALEVTANLAQIQAASERARTLVQQVLTFSRTQARSAPVAVSLPPLVGDTVAFLRASVPANVSFSTALDPECPPVLADPTQLRQAVVNLCTNAWQALEGRPGSVRVTLDRVDRPTADARALPDLRAGAWARLSVTDEGRGMDAATRERAVEPFFTTRPMGQGTGLGLSVVHGIVRGLGGSMELRSVPGEGTSVHLFLPATEASPEHAHSASAPPAAAVTGGEVLVVDDEQGITLAVAQALNRVGWAVTSVGDAEGALALVERAPQRFSLVVTDYDLPGRNGLELCRALARVRQGLPVVLITGYLTPSLEEEARQAGVREVLAKPFVLADVLSAAARYASRREG